MVMQKVLFAKIEAPTYNSDAIVRAWEENGFEVIHFNWQYERFNLGTGGMRYKLLNLAKETNPDVIFLHVQNSEALDLPTIIELQQIGKVIQYTFDVRTPERTEWMYNYARYIHYSFFACQEDVKECMNRGTTNVGFLASSADYNLYKKYSIPQNQPEIVFIGNNYVTSNLEFDCAEERQQMIEFLEKEYPTKFRAYGLGQKHRMVNPQEEAMLYNTCKIAISQNNFDRTWYTSDRLWRIMGSGALCLSKHFYGIEKTFKKEIDLDWWKSLDELKQLIDFYLSDDAERNTIADCGYEYVRKYETWTKRIETVKSVL
jgi:hypothetical protein